MQHKFKKMKNDNSVATFDAVYQDYLKDKNVFKRKFKEMMKQQGLHVDTVEVIPNNSVYLKLYNYFFNEKFEENFIIETYLINSRVQIHKEFELKIRNSITISLENGSHLRFCPYKDNGIEISRLYVEECNQNNGDGTLLMNFIFNTIFKVLKNFPEIVLECTGEVGYKQTLIINSIQNQTKFFRKFGFRVDKNVSKYPYYVKMVFDFKNFVNNEFNIKNFKK